jgi:hypothetical protein
VGPIRAVPPIPRHPETARITRAYKGTTCETPEACPGLFFWSRTDRRHGLEVNIMRDGRTGSMTKAIVGVQSCCISGAVAKQKGEPTVKNSRGLAKAESTEEVLIRD